MMSMFSRISKEAKILIGITCLAAASLIWFNLITQQRQGFNPISIGGSSPALPGSSTPTVQIPEPPKATPETIEPYTEASSNAESSSGDIAVIAPASSVASVTTPEASTEASTPTQPQIETTTATIPDTPQTTLQALPVTIQEVQAISNVEIAELPFLVTSPPSSLSENAELEASAQAAADGSETQRASINPFAPLVLVEKPSETSSSAIVDVPIPSAPQPIVETAQTPNTISVPTPPPALSLEASPPTRNAALPMLATTGLLKPLPSGSLPTTPGILTQALAPTVPTTSPVEPKSSPNLALTSAPALLAPKLNAEMPTLPASTASTDSFQAEQNPDLITTPLTESVEQDSTTSAATAVGASTLSRYLRDNNVRFTGSVIGPVSVGVFRSNNSNAPIIVSLGQSFPETSFVLSSLKGQQAEIKDNDDVQSLALDLWR